MTRTLLAFIELKKFETRLKSLHEPYLSETKKKNCYLLTLTKSGINKRKNKVKKYLLIV